MPEPLTPYLPRLLIEWERERGADRHRGIPGTLAFVDLSGFTTMSERLAKRGKVGAEEVTDVLNSTFARLLAVAYENGGSLLKFGGDALLLFFTGAEHTARACHSAVGMRRKLRELGALRTSAGVVRLRMSIGVHSDTFLFFAVGALHHELVVSGPAASRTVAMEQTAEAGEIVVSAETAALLPRGLLGEAKGEGVLLRKAPPPPLVSLRGMEKEAEGLDLASYLPVALREHLAAGGGEGEHRQVSIAFVHFGGVDALAGSDGPERAADAVDEVISAAQRAAADQQICFLGTDVDADGGKIILVAGAPQATEGDEERILRAVRSIAEAGCALPVRVGVNRGPVFAGDVGPPYRRTYTVIGDAVNLAARVMGRAGAGEVLATAGVIDRSRALFAVSPLEPFRVKGKARPVLAYRVGAPLGSRRSDAAPSLPMIGREREMAELRRALEEARTGIGRLVEISGEAGIGKSRIVGELRGEAAGDVILAVACEQYESSTPYATFRSLLRGLLGIGAATDPGTAGEALARAVAESAPDLAKWLPLLAVPLDATVGATPESDRLAPEFRSARLRQVTSELLGRMLPRPALVIFEDAHWMDEASAELLRHLVASEAPGRPWLLVATRRPGPGGFAAPDDPAPIRVALEPLPAEASESLAAAAAEAHLLPAHVIAALAERSGGHPLFLQELIAASGQGVETMPDTVEALITARIDTLAPRDRTVLRYASVLGGAFSADLVAAIAAGEVAVDSAAWNRLTGFVDATAPGTFRFRHALFRDVAYEGLPFRRRRVLHERAGRALEDRAGANAEDVADLLSLHFAQAQQFDRAWRYARVAADRAREAFANVDAATLYRRALDASRHVHGIAQTDLAIVWEALGDVCHTAGLFGESAGAFREARRLAEPPDVPRIMVKEGVIRERSGRYTQALRWYSRAIRDLDALGDGARGVNRVWVTLAAAAARLWQGRYTDCVRLCLGAVTEAKGIGDERSLARAYFLLDSAYTDLGDPECARYRGLAFPIYRKLGDLIGQATVLNNLGVDAYYEGRWEEALVYYERSREARERAGDVVHGAGVANNIGEILSDQGRIDDAEILFRDALRIWRPAGFPIGVALATSNLGRAAARAGRLDDAERLLGEALDGFRAIGAESYVLECEARIAERAVLAGRDAEALDVATAALERASRASGGAVLQAMLHRIRGYAGIQAGSAALAEAWLRESLDLGRSLKASYEVGLTLEALSRLGHLAGMAETAPWEEEAREILERLGVVRTPHVPLPAAVG